VLLFHIISVLFVFLEVYREDERKDLFLGGLEGRIQLAHLADVLVRLEEDRHQLPMVAESWTEEQKK
jgi:hypothetical protein